MTGVCIGSIGELLVEFMCTEKDGRNLRAAAYMGPYPSGAPGIFIDQAARVAKSFAGQAVFAGAVGDDAFGKVILDRLKNDGVNVSLIRIVRNVPTGSAFVSYNTDGSRDFVFNIAHSAAAHLPETALIEAGFLSNGIKVLHISGSMLGNPAARGVALELCEALYMQGVAVSIDPNIRVELMNDPGYLEAIRRIMSMSRFILPSDADAALLFPNEAFSDWSSQLLAAGAQVVVLKRGEHGCIGRDAADSYECAAHPVLVVDPTGAGDCFCATLVTLMAAGQTLQDAMRRANAAGALAVSKLGPMEGNSSLSEIDALLGGAT